MTATRAEIARWMRDRRAIEHHGTYFVNLAGTLMPVEVTG